MGRRTLACTECGGSNEPGRRYCKKCYNAVRKSRYDGSVERIRYGKVSCSMCGNTIIKSRPSQTMCIACARQCQTATNESRVEQTSNRSYITRKMFAEFLGRKLTYNEVVHHLDEDILNNAVENLVLMARSDHCALHRFLRLQRALLEKSNGQYDENCWKPLRVELTTTWIERSNVKVLKIVPIGQSAAEPLLNEEGSETMHVAPKS